MKVIKLLFIFTVFLFGFYFLCCGFFGQNGYLYNKSLKELLIQREYTMDKISIELNSLIQRQIALSTDEGLRDIAIRYTVDGDNVYLFSDSAYSESVYAGNIHDTDVQLFVPYSKSLCLLIALIPSTVITLAIWFIFFLIKRNYNETNEPLTEQENSFDEFGQ